MKSFSRVGYVLLGLIEHKIPENGLINVRVCVCECASVQRKKKLCSNNTIESLRDVEKTSKHRQYNFNVIQNEIFNDHVYLSLFYSCFMCVCVICFVEYKRLNYFLLDSTSTSYRLISSWKIDFLCLYCVGALYRT